MNVGVGLWLWTWLGTSCTWSWLWSWLSFGGLFWRFWLRTCVSWLIKINSRLNSREKTRLWLVFVPLWWQKPQKNSRSRKTSNRRVPDDLKRFSEYTGWCWTKENLLLCSDCYIPVWPEQDRKSPEQIKCQAALRLVEYTPLTYFVSSRQKLFVCSEIIGHL